MMLNTQHLARCLRVGYPILRPGDLAYWELDQALIKVTVLGGGTYRGVGGTYDGVTIQTNAAATSVTYGEIAKGETRTVQPAHVLPREIVTRTPGQGYSYAGHTWGFDLTCPVHGETHTAPISPCRFNRIEIALIDEVTDATEHGRIIDHAAAREIAAWYTDAKPGDLSTAAMFVRNGQLPGEDTDTVWTALGGFNLDLEKAEWRRAGLRALREYIRAAPKPRYPFAPTLFVNWPDLELWELDYDGRYQISPERHSELGGELQTRWVVRFCDDRVGTAPTPQAARRLAVHHHATLVTGHTARTPDTATRP